MSLVETKLYDYIPSTGIVIPDTSVVRQVWVDEFKSILGNDIDTTEETNIGRLIESLTMAFRTIIGINAQNMNQINPSQATGIYLDAIGALYGVARVPATKTTVVVKLTGTPNTVVAANSSVANIDNIQFFTSDTATIGANGSVSVQAVSSETGPTNSQITTPLTAIAGWNAVETESVIAIGVVAESDDSFRERIINAMSRGIGTIESIYNAVYAADASVSSVVVLENGKGVPVVKRGVFMPPHSIYVCVYGGADAKIAEAIYKTKTAGATLVNDSGYGTKVEEDVTDERSGSEYSIAFYRPTEITALSSIVVSAHRFSATNISTLTENIKTSLIEYITGKGIGGTLSSYDAATYITNHVPGVRVNYVEFDDESEYTFNAYQIGIIEDNAITVNFS